LFIYLVDHIYDYNMGDTTEYKEKVKINDDEAKVEKETKDQFGNKVKEKHEVKTD
jgi:hypothetical protein